MATQIKYTLEDIRNTPILFVVGKGRSGTTLLSNIIDSHPNVASATESRFLLILWQRYKNMKEWKPEMAEEFIKNIHLDLHVKSLWTFQEGYFEALQEFPRETTVSDLIKSVYIYRKSEFPKEKIQFIVDKNPMYTLFVDRIKQLFPEAKFYRLMRDPRDNVTSHLRYNDHHYGVLTYKWYDFNKRVDELKNKYPEDVFTQNFEHLILNKDQFFEQFGEFSGIKNLSQLEEERLKYKSQLSEKFNDQLKDQHKASMKPLDKSKIGHYKNVLTAAQLNVVEGICFPYAASFGYIAVLENTSINPFLLLAWKSKHFYINALSLVLYNFPFSAMRVLSNFFDKKNKTN